MTKEQLKFIGDSIEKHQINQVPLYYLSDGSASQSEWRGSL